MPTSTYSGQSVSEHAVSASDSVENRRALSRTGAHILQGETVSRYRILDMSVSVVTTIHLCALFIRMTHAGQSYA